MFLVVQRDFLDNPKPGYIAVVDFCDCSGFHLSPPTGEEPYAIDSSGCRISMAADINGITGFPIRGGGTCSDGAVQVFICERIPMFTSPALASPDQNGDSIVDNTDMAIVQTKLSTVDETADFDCDGIVTLSDIDIVRDHFGHSASSVLAIDPPGRVRFALQAPRPNPARQGFAVSYSLPSSVPATLELLDISGRRLQRRNVGSLGPGTHTVHLGDQINLAPGIYLVRLTQGLRTHSTKAIIVR